jgi:hypothetical protein
MRFTADNLNGYGWDIAEDGEERYLVMGLSQAEAEYATTLLNSDAFDTDDDFELARLVREAIEPTACSVCETFAFAASLDSAGRCDECAS